MEDVVGVDEVPRATDKVGGEAYVNDGGERGTDGTADEHSGACQELRGAENVVEGSSLRQQSMLWTVNLLLRKPPRRPMRSALLVSYKQRLKVTEFTSGSSDFNVTVLRPWSWCRSD